MRKFIIKDETGKQYDITEQCIDEEPAPEEETPTPEIKDEEGLSSEEIAALKKLAASADKLIALITDEEPEAPEIKDEEEPKEPIADEEEVIDTEPVEAKDSVGSIGTKAKDSSIKVVDSQLDIADAWNKRFNKVHKGE